MEHFVELAKHGKAGTVSSADLIRFARKQVAVQSLVAAYRMVGTRKARLDPLEWAPPPVVPDLAPAFHGLSPADLSTVTAIVGALRTGAIDTLATTAGNAAAVLQLDEAINASR